MEESPIKPPSPPAKAQAQMEGIVSGSSDSTASVLLCEFWPLLSLSVPLFPALLLFPVDEEEPVG